MTLHNIVLNLGIWLRRIYDAAGPITLVIALPLIAGIIVRLQLLLVSLFIGLPEEVLKLAPVALIVVCAWATTMWFVMKLYPR